MSVAGFDGDLFTPPFQLKTGRMTSGRRTVEGNRAVGGVARSDHLTGKAADYWGSDLGAVLAEVRGLQGHKKSFIHGDGSKRHVHAVGDWDVPYYGKRGTIGLKRR